ncbi:uncharacterized protein CIMG_02414 [Coccidioides immitis RS]|uniref:Uncharacterized protein n=1 Tax=Coccidioides immitis (strain RS) TaxID=246410 RepID=J3KLB8_COCIM|nr:uncharacterized protein CIMG_02414 [Coccidioides immitis RS]EAS37060.3 hypothetical protein CIMG_02414 [Coccidioides immitis RS]
MPGMEPALLLRHAPYKAIDLCHSKTTTNTFSSHKYKRLLSITTASSSKFECILLSLAYDIGDSQEGLFSKPLSQHHGQQSHHGDQHARKEASTHLWSNNGGVFSSIAEDDYSVRSRGCMSDVEMPCMKAPEVKNTLPQVFMALYKDPVTRGGLMRITQ